jgi:hypothetical protein
VVVDINFITAMRKYGIENFIIEILDTARNLERIKRKRNLLHRYYLNPITIFFLEDKLD